MGRFEDEKTLDMSPPANFSSSASSRVVPIVAELNCDERALVWALLIESGHIPLRTILGTCSRDLYRPLRLRLLAWAQRVVFQDLHHVSALLQANRSWYAEATSTTVLLSTKVFCFASFPTRLRLRVSIFLVCCSFYLHWRADVLIQVSVSVSVSWETNRTISLRTAETEQLYQVKRMIGGIGDMLFSVCSQTENV